MVKCVHRVTEQGFCNELYRIVPVQVNVWFSGMYCQSLKTRSTSFNLQLKCAYVKPDHLVQLFDDLYSILQFLLCK